MKLRILGNSIRLRLTKTEVEDVRKDMHVSDSIDFGGHKLIYALQGSDVDESTASFNGHFISVDIPSRLLVQWADSDQISIENEIELPEGQALKILVEKDFACLTRDGEEDKFPNPKADC